MEHAVFRPESFKGIAVKATKGPKFGFYPYYPEGMKGQPEDLLELKSASPGQYLLRLQVWDRIAPGLTVFEGFTRLEGHLSIITSQRWFIGRNATAGEIALGLGAQGFQPVVAATAFDDPSIWYHPGQNVALFDVSPSNIIWSDGELVPIDIVPVMPTGLMREVLGSAMR
jgi:hypothetical protein